MDFYTISTLKSLDLHHLGDRYFCLAHFFIKDENYRNFFLSIRKKFPSAWITLDNSAAEKSLVTENILLSIVEQLQPNEVIAPDVLFDKDATLDNLKSFIQKLQNSKTQIFACPQGSTKDEWIQCYTIMMKDPNVSTIGLSKITVPFAFKGLTDDLGIAESRHEAIDYLFQHKLIKKPIHFLGMGDPREYIYYKQFPDEVKKFFRSSDSCYTVLAAVQGVDFLNDDFRRIPTYEDFYSHDLTESERALAISNVAFLKQYNKGV